MIDDGRVPDVIAQEAQFLGIETLKEFQQLLPVFLYHGPQHHPAAVFQHPLFLVSHDLVPLWLAVSCQQLAVIGLSKNQDDDR